jgi:hypothetical protein
MVSDGPETIKGCSSKADLEPEQAGFQPSSVPKVFVQSLQRWGFSKEGSPGYGREQGQDPHPPYHSRQSSYYICFTQKASRFLEKRMRFSFTTVKV